MLATRSVLVRAGIFVLLLALASQAEAETFRSGDLFYAANRLGSHIYNITGGGDFADAVPFAPGGGPGHASLGQLAWSHDLTTMYATNYVGDSVYQVDASGKSSLYVQVPEPLGIVVTSSGRILVNSYSARQVLDITNPLKITTFASLPTVACNMRQLPSGEILVAGSGGNVFDIASGSATVYASIEGAGGSYLGDIDFTWDGRVFVSGGLSSANRVYEITGGGVFTTPFATLVDAPGNGGAFGLAIDPLTQQILVAPLGTNYVVDITPGGVVDASSASPQRFARNIPTTNDMAIDFVPWRPRPSFVPTLASASASAMLIRLLDGLSPDRIASSGGMTGDLAVGSPPALSPRAPAPFPYVPDPFVPEPYVPPYVPDPFVPPYVPDPYVPEPFVPDPFVPDPFVPDPFVPDPTPQEERPESLPEPGTLTIWALGALLCAAAGYRHRSRKRRAGKF